MTIAKMAQMNFSYRSLAANSASLSKSTNRLSSGLRINSAADDAAGLAISEQMRGQIRGLDMAYSNAQNALSMANTAEGSLSSSTEILTRMRELAVQASNATLGDVERGFINDEITQLTSELDRIAESASFNGKTLLDGSFAGPESAATFQIGAGGSDDQRISMSIGDMSARALGLSDIDVSTLEGANSAIDAIDRASERVLDQRSNIGAVQNRLEHSMNSLGITMENLAASESRIRDLDMAFESMRNAQNSILTQASLAMMTQTMNLSRDQMVGLLMR